MNEELRKTLKDLGIIGYLEEPHRFGDGTEGSALTVYFEIGSRYFESEGARAKAEAKLLKEGARKAKELKVALQSFGAGYTCVKDVEFTTAKFLDLRYLDIDTGDEEHYNASCMWSPRAIVLKKIAVLLCWPEN